MIRVSGLKEQLDEAVNQSDRTATLELLKEIRTRVTEMIDVQMKCLMSAVLPALKEKDVAIVDFESMAAHERDAMSRYFQDEIFPVLTPQAVDPSHPFPYISGGSLNLGLMVRPSVNGRIHKAQKSHGDELFVRLKIPPFVDRLLSVDAGRNRFILAEDLISAHIQMLIPDAASTNCYAF